MRLLHTSDWHVGRTFHGADLLAEQEAVLTHLAELVTTEQVDVVVVAGDIYDRAVPSAEAVRVATKAMSRIRQAGAQLVITPGNHDSAARLGAFADFAAAGGLHLRATIAGLAEPVLLNDEHGDVAIYGIPYLEPEPSRHALGVPEARGHTGVLTEAMRRVREDLATRAKTRSVVLAHAFVTGGSASESERTIAVGGVEQVPGDVFEGVDYVALGHLHGPQTLAEHLRYSGSPLAYSFSEARQRKSVWLVDLDAAGLAEVRRHELPVPRPLATLRGELQELLDAPEHEEWRDHFLSVTVTDRVRPVDAMRRLRERFPYAVHLDWEPEGGLAGAQLKYADAVRGRTDIEIARSFLDDCRGAFPTETEERLVFLALEAANRAAVAKL
ncbi:exonuclease SbcCD subunit D C-terminal domain-containing protein [Amycolatopsis carbonis]|uniref:Nuclease SbcCD subunit D n=1 Tax=Amycolatopsis carbonis TaxID=715471 RepID=A0A9Y2INR9_9PSEU|nr:exonuclease SbcCD subunit D [Amycolatopsis sp. 2-15]WIX82008.1 exonuclease SbcCD subunit D C-terminal domain-containing protein [Amycolatopsis sp. 2-15]